MRALSVFGVPVEMSGRDREYVCVCGEAFGDQWDLSKHLKTTGHASYVYAVYEDYNVVQEAALP